MEKHFIKEQTEVFSIFLLNSRPACYPPIFYKCKTKCNFCKINYATVIAMCVWQNLQEDNKIVK